MLTPRAITLALLATGGIAATANADLCVWTGAGGDTNWRNPANWSTNSIPSSQDTAYFDPAFGTVTGSNIIVGTIISYRPLSFTGNTNIRNTSYFYSDVTFNGGITILRSDVVLNVYRTLNWNGGYIWPNTGASNTSIQVNNGGTMNIGAGVGSLASHITVMTGGTLNVNTPNLGLQNFSASDIVVLSTQSGGTMNFNAGCYVSTTQARASAGAVINYGQVNTRNGNTTFTDSVYFFNSGKIHTESNTYIGDPAFIPAGDNYIASGEYEIMNSFLTFSGGRTVKGISNTTRVTLSGPNAYFGGLENIQANEGVLTIRDGAYPTVGNGRAVGFNNYGTINLYPGSYLYSSTRFTNATSGWIVNFARGTNYGENGFIVTPEYVNLLGGYAQLVSLDGYTPSTGDRLPIFRVTDASPYYGAFGAFNGVFGTNWPAYNVNIAVKDSYHAFDYVMSCPVDFNEDGFLDGFDYDDFVACFEGFACFNGKTADYNHDGFVDGFDYDEFVEAFETGCL